jgi:hypothetical protein
MQGVKDTFIHWKLVLRCSAIGAYIGLLPGLGGGPAQWISYAHAVQSSPNKERFGKGAVEGVLGPGAANNSKEGGALVPTIAFGVPGSVSMAILLGAFIIQGIVPGPDLLDPDKYLTLTFSFVWIIVVSNIITVAVCFLFLDQIAKITYVKGTYLIPFLLLLVYLGGFAVKNSFGDMVMVILFGALGWVMVRCDWQRPPLLIGLVLGQIAESNLFIASKIYGLSWLLRPGVLLLFALLIAGVVYPMWQKRKEKQKKSEADVHEERFAGEKKIEPIPRGVRTFNRLFALAFVLLFAYVMREVFFGFGADEERARLFPLIIGIPGLILASMAFGKELFTTTRAVTIDPDEEELEPAVARRRMIAIISWIIGFFGLIWLVGFVVSSVVATFAYLKFGNSERWSISIALTGLAWLFFYGLFDYILHLPFPDGELFIWLGWA